MKTKATRFLMCLIFMGLGISLGFAQDTADQSKPKSDIRTITGCLSKGDSANEFMLAGNDGSTWEVRSSKVALGKHVGETHEGRVRLCISELPYLAT